jgi:hypothetical protein
MLLIVNATGTHRRRRHLGAGRAVRDRQRHQLRGGQIGVAIEIAIVSTGTSGTGGRDAVT